MSGPSQPKVTDEYWEDDRIRGFLDLNPVEAIAPDYHVLLQAYQYMTADDYKRFLGFFAEAGRDINAKSPEGETILDRVSAHARSADYAEFLLEAGAKMSDEL